MKAYEHLDGKKVSGNYMGVPMIGKVRRSELKFGTMFHYVNLDEPIVVFGKERASVVLESDEVLAVE